MRSFIIIAAIVLAVVLGGVFFLLNGTKDSAPSDRGQGTQAALNGSGVSSRTSAETAFDKAPAFSLEDYEGNIVSSSDFEDKLLVVNAWASWCPFCVDELPDFGRLQETFPEDIVVIAIDRAEPRERAKSFSDDLGVTDKLVFLLDPRDSFYRSIGGFSMPETLFVDRAGNIRVHKRGPMEFDEMQEKVNQILDAEGA